MVCTNEERFVRLYWKYHDLILQVTYNRLHDYHQAQDVCQDTFMRMMHCMDLSLRDESIKGWLIVTADNMSKDILRKSGRYQRFGDLHSEEAGEIQVRAVGGDCFDEIVRRDLRAKILKRLYEYNREQYEIVLLVCCLQMSLADAAKQMSMTYEQISMKLHRARKWIRTNFEEEYREIMH